MDRFGPKIGAEKIGAHGLRAAARPGAVPVPLRVRRGVDDRARGRAEGPPPRGQDVLKAGDTTAFPVGPGGRAQGFNATEAPVRFLMLSTKDEPAVAVYPDSNKIGVWTGRKDEHVICASARASTTTTGSRSPLEEGLALAAVGRDGVDDLAAARPGARRRSARTARPPWRGGTRRGRRPAARRPPAEQRRLDLARALARVELQPGGQERARQPVAPRGAARPGSRRPARWRSSASACAPPAARTAPPARGLKAR